MKIVWLILGVVFAALVLGWWVSRSIPFSGPQPNLESQDTTLPPQVSSAASPLADTNFNRSNPRWNRRSSRILTEGSTNWEDQIEEILATDDTDAEKSKRLLALMPELPLDSQVEVAQHLGHMLPDQDYPSLAAYLVDPETPEPLLDVLLLGLLGRTDGIRLPVLLAIAEDDQHPKSEEALGYLEGFLGQDFGTNWTQWGTALDQRIQTPPATDEMSTDSAESQNR